MSDEQRIELLEKQVEVLRNALSQAYRYTSPNQQDAVTRSFEQHLKEWPKSESETDK